MIAASFAGLAVMLLGMYLSSTMVWYAGCALLGFGLGMAAAKAVGRR